MKSITAADCVTSGFFSVPQSFGEVVGLVLGPEVKSSRLAHRRDATPAFAASSGEVNT
jgi:hypothetical protein